MEDEARLLRILAADPENAGALAGMGWVRSRQKNYLGAISYLERAKQKRPTDRSLLLALDLARFRVILAEAQKSLESDETRLAEKFFSLALQIRPHNQEALAGMHAASLRARDVDPTRHP